MTGIRSSGLTLIELMVTVAIIAILTGIAWPMYDDLQMRNRRVDATMTLLQARQHMEKCYSRVRDYTHASCALPADLTTSAQGHYNIALAAVGTETYTLLATPQGIQVADVECAVISITNSGDTSGSTNANCWKD